MNAMHGYRVARWLYLRRIPVLPKLLYYANYLLFNCSIPASAKIGAGTRVGYGGMGIVIHSRATIGKNCLIAQQVTIGGRSGHLQVPTLGDAVLVGAGAKIIGPVVIGSECVIGANAVVTEDLPDRCVAVGIPAKIVRRDIDIREYLDL